MMALGEAFPAGHPFLCTALMVVGTLCDVEGILRFW